MDISFKDDCGWSLIGIEVVGINCVALAFEVCGFLVIDLSNG